MRAITTGDTMHVHGGFGEKVDYTARVSVKLTDPVDARLLQHALTETQKRYPYLCVRIRKDDHAFYYEDNPDPIVLLHTPERISLNAEETNFHLWAVCYWEEWLHLDCYHGITDGTGMYKILATLLYYYCKEKYGITDQTGIWTVEDTIDKEELCDPQDELKAPVTQKYKSIEMRPAFTLETDGNLTPSEPTIWDVEIPEEAFIRFTSANDASPGTMVSILLARAIDALYPNAEKDIVGAYVINARPMLQAKKTYHNCLTMALFDYEDKIRRMPLDRQCTVYRGKTFIQSDEDRVAELMAVNAEAIRAAQDSAKTLDEKKKVFGSAFSGGEGLVTYLVSYTGKWSCPGVEGYMKEFWSHPPNTFSLMVEIGAAGGKIFLTIQQRFREDTVREAFLKQLEEHEIPYTLKRVLESDIAHIPEP